MKKRFFIMTAAGACLAILLAANTYIFAENNNSSVQEIRVQTVQVKEEPLKKVHWFEGTAVSDEMIDVYPLFGKEATEWLVQEGDTVTEGEKLVAYSDTELEMELKEAEDALSEEGVKADYYASLESTLQSRLTGLDKEKDKALIEELSGQLSEAELEESLASSRETALGKKVSDLKEKMDNLAITSPISGTVQRVEQHSDPSQPIFTIHSAGSLLVKVSLSPKDAVVFKEGEEAMLQLSSTKKVKASVLRKQSDESGETSHVYLQTENAELTENEPVTGFVYETIKEKALFLPVNAVKNSGQKKFVYVVADGFLQKREVATGAVSKGTVEIVKGAAKGESAVAEPSNAYYHHQRAFNVTEAALKKAPKAQENKKK